MCQKLRLKTSENRILSSIWYIFGNIEYSLSAMISQPLSKNFEEIVSLATVKNRNPYKDNRQRQKGQRQSRKVAYRGVYKVIRQPTYNIELKKYFRVYLFSAKSKKFAST